MYIFYEDMVQSVVGHKSWRKSRSKLLISDAMTISQEATALWILKNYEKSGTTSLLKLQSLQEVQEGIGSSTVGVVRGLQSIMPSQRMSKMTGTMGMHLKRNSGRNSWRNWSGHRINNMIVERMKNTYIHQYHATMT